MSDSKGDVSINPLRTVRIDKVTVNIATGKSGEPLEKAKKVLNQLTEKTPATKKAKKAIKDFGVRKGEPIAAVVTLRGTDASEFLRRALDAVSNKVNESSFDGYGNFSFGIKEHIEIPGTRYVPELGIFGATIHVTLGRPGYRIRSRRIRRARIGHNHYVSHGDAVKFMQDNFGTNIQN